MDATSPPIPAGAKAVPNPCPQCGSAQLHIEARAVVAPVGGFSLAGVQTKFPVRERIFLVCRACSAEVEGRPDGNGRAQFDADAMRPAGTATW
jgi:hypothetical protein